MKEITLNGESYILKIDIPSIKKEVKRFNINIINKLHKSLNKTLFECYNDISEEYALNLNRCIVIDKANIQLIEGKTEESKRFLAHYINSESYGEIKNEISFIPTELIENKARYSLEILNKLLNFLQITDEALSISMLKDKPIKLENKHFMCILAARIEEET